jgi:heme exporter protein C
MTADLSVARRIIQRGRVLVLLGLLGEAGIFVRALKYTPVEASQGLAQKIFYLHVPAAWSALFLGFGLVGVSSALFLWLEDPRLDRFAASSAEVGLAFGTVMLTTGPIWAKPIWGTWWSWDMRLSMTLLLYLLFLGYLALRSAIDDRGERGRYSAVVGVMALILVPFIHLTVYLFRTLHPQPIVLKPSAPSLPPEMLITLLSAIAVAGVLYLGFVTMRYGIALAQEVNEEARHE